MTNFQIASMLHRIFAVELESMIERGDGEACDPDAVANSDACELGKWIAAHTVELTHLPHFQELQAAHCRFHAAATDMAARFRQGDMAGAREINASTFRAASDAVLAAIAAMEIELKLRPLKSLPNGSVSAN